MTDANKEFYKFDDFNLDVAERLLLRGGSALPLPEKALETLCALVKRANHLVSREELLNEVWTDAFVEENNLDKNISLLRQILGERTDGKKFIETVRGRGYRFVASIETAQPDAKIRTVAVLPFKPLVAENRNEALELGMAETLIAKLSESDEIITRPLSATRRYDSLEQDSLAAGRELETEAVLDGSIQTFGDRIRISARFLRVSDGRQLWAGQFDEKLTDIFAVQDSISEKVSEALKIALARREKKRYPENIQAYQLYLKGRYHALRKVRSETDKSINYFQQAIEIAPDFALAYVGLAAVYHSVVLTSEVPALRVMPKAKAAALRAIEIDDTLAEAHAVLGFTIFWYEWDWAAAEAHYRRGLELDPRSVDLHYHYAHFLSNLGRHEQALTVIKLARDLDPLNFTINAVEGQILFFAGKADEALERLNDTIDLNPNFWLTHLFISRVYSQKGMHTEAIEAATKAKETSDGNAEAVALIGYELARSGEQKKARAVLEELRQMSKTRYVPPYNFALVFNGLGEREKALDYLEKAFAEKNALMVFLKVEPKWNNLRSEACFIDLMRRMNFE